MFRVFNCLTVEHDWRLVLLAALICFLTSLAAINLFHRARAARGRSQLAWLVTAGVTTGCGIWATHFVAMLAYAPGRGAGYDIPMTLLSLLLAASITALGLSVALLNDRSSTATLGGAILGVSTGENRAQHDDSTCTACARQ